MRVVALPGLDGTGELLVPFASAANARIVSYPTDRVLTLDEYADLVEVDEETVLIAESFSGPIAARVASRTKIKALVLVGSFVTPPLPRFLRLLPLTMLARVNVPDWLLAFWMLSPYSTRERVTAVRNAIGRVAPRVLASRIRIALSLDEALPNVPIVDARGTRDRLVLAHARKKIVARRGDVVTVDVDGPHALLFTRPAESWEAILGALRSVC